MASTKVKPSSSSWADEVDAAKPLNTTPSMSKIIAQFEELARKEKIHQKTPPKNKNKKKKAAKSQRRGVAESNSRTHNGSTTTNKNSTGSGNLPPLSKTQARMHKEFREHSTQNSNIIKSFFGDNQPTTGASELRFKMIDWIERPLAPSAAGNSIFFYYLDVGLPFFADASAVAGEQYTRSKVRSVKLWFLSPPTDVDETPLLQVLCAIPVKDQGNNNALSLLGQSSTIIHPDVRRPWVMVGNWNWEQIFENSQYQPYEFPAAAVSGARDLLALFNYIVIDAVSGTPFTSSATGSTQLKLEIELQAPIPLVPTPLRVFGEGAGFDTPPSEEIATTDNSPVQYVLKSIHRQM